MDSELKRDLIGWGVKGVLYKAFIGAVLMLSAGRWDWYLGWAYVGIFLAFDAATALVACPRDPGLLVERSRSHPDAQTWDKILMPLSSGLLPLASYILAGLNERWNWGPEMGPGWIFLGAALTIGGYGLLVWAMSANSFFSPQVRIQVDRQHRLVDSGPYGLIRHPGYLGAILFSAAVPLLLGSWWALIPGGAAAALLILRTELEDQFLLEALPGYKNYLNRVRYRLIPGVW